MIDSRSPFSLFRTLSYQAFVSTSFIWQSQHSILLSIRVENFVNCLAFWGRNPRRAPSSLHLAQIFCSLLDCGILLSALSLSRELPSTSGIMKHAFVALS